MTAGAMIHPSPLSACPSYLSPVTNVCQVSAVKASVPPSRSLVSRTRITPSLPTSTHCPPSVLLYVLLRHSIAALPLGSLPMTH